MLNSHLAFGGNAGLYSFQSKAEALQYAIEFTAFFSENGRTPNCEAAKELFDFICRNVVLPETKPSECDAILGETLAILRPLIDRAKNIADEVEQKDVATSTVEN